MKIQINSLEALERLIGGDNELEIEIRNSVTENFAKKHMRSVVNTDLIQKLQTALTSSIQDDLLETVGSSYIKNYKLTPKAKEYLDERIGYSVESALSKLVEAKIGSLDTLKKIDDLLDKQSKYVEQQLTDAILEKRLDKMVDNKIKERLGL